MIDVTFASPAAARRVFDWRVEQDVFSFNDHKYVTYRIRKPSGRPRAEPRNMGWAVRHMDIDMFDACMTVAAWPSDNEGEQHPMDLETEVHDLRCGLWAACDASMPRRKLVKRRALHWWSEDIAEARRGTGRLWRRMSRARKEGRALNAENLREDLRVAKKELKRLIRSAKDRAWSDFLSTLDQDPWGKPYKLVTDRLKPWSPPMTKSLEPACVEDVVATLFPDGPAGTQRRNPGPAPWNENWELTEEEMVRAVAKLGGDWPRRPDLTVCRVPCCAEQFHTLARNSGGSLPKA